MAVATVVIADASADFRGRIAKLLREFDVEVVGEVAELAELMPTLGRTLPDFLVLDMSLAAAQHSSYGSFLETLLTVKGAAHITSVIVISVMGTGDELTSFSRKIGAYACIGKEEIATELPRVLCKR